MSEELHMILFVGYFIVGLILTVAARYVGCRPFTLGGYVLGTVLWPLFLLGALLRVEL